MSTNEIGPGEFAAVFLLDRPQQPARLVEVGVVRPGIERREALLAGAGAAAAVGDAVGAGAVPRHADEERPVVAEVGRPPILRIRHQGMQVLDHGVEVEGLELLGVVERLAHRIGQTGVPVETLKAQTVRAHQSRLVKLLCTTGHLPALFSSVFASMFVSGRVLQFLRVVASEGRACRVPRR